MHIAMVIDHERLVQEHVMLKRLAVGLMDAGARLTRIVPEHIDAERVAASERQMALANRIEVAMRVLPWMRSNRTAELVEAMQRGLPDVLYAIGRDAWSVSLELAGSIDRPVALDVCRAELVRHAPRGRAAQHVGAYIVPTGPLAAAIRRRVDPDLVSLIPMGVAISSKPQPVAAQGDRAIAMAIVGSSSDLEAYKAMLAGLRRAVADLANVQIVLELRGVHEHDIWREVERLGLSGRISPIQDASLHRALLTRCDMLVVPEALGEPGSLLLECMAAGMTIIAREDPYLDMLTHEKSALVLPSGTVDEWAGSLRRCLTDSQFTQKLGEGARSVAARRHRSSDQVARLMDVFDKVITGESYAFSADSPAGRTRGI